ncbi:hypothetical protein UFOVP28_50 [uncultured Caudovirales phage]|uniref:Uncharacterized protein n=1 Tax=uncultured Caudovirales phage TaxID=2100421 RepID=A0A6J5KKP2_9CAUD|nr:hypothetical protein UFOVP28_50 [uncultured Caudovirales phage]
MIPDSGSAVNTWGTLINSSFITLIDTAVAGYQSIALADADYTLSVSNGSTDQSRTAVLAFTGAITANRNIICPAVSKKYTIVNNCTGAFSLVVKTLAGSGITVPNGTTMSVWCDGTNYYPGVSYSSILTVGTFAVSGNTALGGNLSIGGTISSSGALSVGNTVVSNIGTAIGSFAVGATPSVILDTSTPSTVTINRAAFTNIVSTGAWTHTGALGATTISTTAVGSVFTNDIRINGAVATSRQINFQTGLLNRWSITTNNTGEGGSNAGSDLYIGAIADNGSTFIGSALFITRATMAASFGGALTATGVISAPAGFSGALTGNVTGNVAGALTGNVTGNVTGATTGAHNGSVGATTPSTGVFTTLSASGATAFTGTVTVATLAGAVIGGPLRNLSGSQPSSGTTTSTWSADAVMMEDGSGNVIKGASLSAVPDLSVNGAVNRLDTGTVAASTWYYVWAISNGTLVGFLYSLSSTAPTMPGGYTYKALVGVVRTNGSAQVVPFNQKGKSWQYVAAIQAILGSTASTWNLVSTANYVPAAISNRVRGFVVTPMSGAAAVAPNSSYSTSINSSVNPPPAGMTTGSAAGSQNTTFDFVLETTGFYYMSGSGAPAGAYVLGFEITY